MPAGCVSRIKTAILPRRSTLTFCLYILPLAALHHFILICHIARNRCNGNTRNSPQSALAAPHAQHRPHHKRLAHCRQKITRIVCRQRQPPAAHPVRQRPKPQPQRRRGKRQNRQCGQKPQRRNRQFLTRITAPPHTQQHPHCCRQQCRHAAVCYRLQPTECSFRRNRQPVVRCRRNRQQRITNIAAHSRKQVRQHQPHRQPFQQIFQMSVPFRLPFARTAFRAAPKKARILGWARAVFNRRQPER